MTRSPFTTRVKSLLAVVAVAIAATTVLVIRSGSPDSPELIQARETCESSWEAFDQGDDAATPQPWSECLVRHPALVDECGLSAQVASAMLRVQSIAEVRIDPSDLRACGDSLY